MKTLPSRTKTGIARLFVAAQKDETADLTVFEERRADSRASTIRKQSEFRCRCRRSERTLLAKDRITKIDLLLADVQGCDSEVVEQFLACGVKPTIIHFEHCHTARPTLDALYRKIVEQGYHVNELEIDALCYLPCAV